MNDERYLGVVRQPREFDVVALARFDRQADPKRLGEGPAPYSGGQQRGAAFETAL